MSEQEQFFVDLKRSNILNPNYLSMALDVATEVGVKMTTGARVEPCSIMWGRMSVDLKKLLLRDVFSRRRDLVEGRDLDQLCADWNSLMPDAQEMLRQLIVAHGSELAMCATIPAICSDTQAGALAAVIELEKSKAVA